MVILTIKFPKGTKTYDYLMENPDHIKIDKDKPLKLITGASKYGICSQDIYVINGIKTHTLPLHVTTKLVLESATTAHTETINKELIKKLSAAPKKPCVPEKTMLCVKITKDKIIQYFGINMYMSLSKKERSILEGGK